MRSAKARRLARRRKGIALPLKGRPILVPGLPWDGIAVLGMDGPPTMAHMEWWTTRGSHATTERDVEQRLLDNWGEGRKAWQIARGKRSQSYRLLRDPRTKQLIRVGVLAIPVTLLDHPQPLWLVVARLGGGREPWYLVTSKPIRTLADAWAVVLAYTRWQIEEVRRASKSELAFESPRVEDWEVRQATINQC